MGIGNKLMELAGGCLAAFIVVSPVSAETKPIDGPCDVVGNITKDITSFKIDDRGDKGKYVQAVASNGDALCEMPLAQFLAGGEDLRKLVTVEHKQIRVKIPNYKKQVIFVKPRGMD